MLTFGEWQTTRRLTKFGHTGEVFEVRNHDGRRGALKHYLPTCPGTKETFLRERDFLASDDASDIKPELLDCEEGRYFHARNKDIADTPPVRAIAMTGMTPPSPKHQRSTRALPPPTSFSTSARVAIDVPPGVVSAV